MLQIFSKNLSQVILDENSSNQNIEKINEHIRFSKTENMTVDISKLNIMDACMIATMGSTTHYINHPEGKINWIVNNSMVEEYTRSMNLGNSEFLVKQ